MSLPASRSSCSRRLKPRPARGRPRAGRGARAACSGPGEGVFTGRPNTGNDDARTFHLPSHCGARAGGRAGSGPGRGSTRACARGAGGRARAAAGTQRPRRPGQRQAARRQGPPASPVDQEINLSALEKMPEDEVRRQIHRLVSQYTVAERLALNAHELEDFVTEILDEMMGLGPIEPLLKDPTVNDILINSHEQVYVERAGVLEPTLVRFKDE